MKYHICILYIHWLRFMRKIGGEFVQCFFDRNPVCSEGPKQSIEKTQEELSKNNHCHHQSLTIYMPTITVNGLFAIPVPVACKSNRPPSRPPSWRAIRVNDGEIRHWVLSNPPPWKESLMKPEPYKWFPRSKCTFPLPGVKSFNYTLLHPKYPELFFRICSDGSDEMKPWNEWTSFCPSYHHLQESHETSDIGKHMQILLMEEILHHQGCTKPRKYWDIYHLTGAGFHVSSLIPPCIGITCSVFPSEKYNQLFTPKSGPLHWRWGHITSASLHKRGWNCFPGAVQHMQLAREGGWTWMWAG